MRAKKPHKSSGKRHGPGRKQRPEQHRHARKDHPRRELPEMLVIQITGLTEEGEAVAVPADWNARRHPPYILVLSGSGEAPAVGQRALARMHRVGKQAYEARIVKVMADEPKQGVIGIFVNSGGRARIEPVDRRIKENWIVPKGEEGGAQHGELVSAELLGGGRRGLGPRQAKITERLGDINKPGVFSLIAIHTHGIPVDFSAQSIAMAEEAEAPVMEPGREDLRSLPLVTIDGEDARDFDDAVFAEPDTASSNPGGWHLIVAIADVAHYVPDGSALDKDAFERGNSVYFPDRVVPMLPKALSNGLCSLNPDEDRYCLAVHLWISASGEIKRYRFVRGLMRSHARLTYELAQEIADNGHGHPLYARVIQPLYAAYGALSREWELRGPLDLNLPEFKIKLDDKGNVGSIAPRARLNSHRLIEMYMVTANVAAAECLIEHRAGGIFRVHEAPSADKLDELRRMLENSGHTLSKGSGTRAQHFNKVLRRSQGTPEEFMVNNAVLRAQMQAFYHHENTGHFGLALAKYCHFTSPIRRYSDLIVHRALIGVIEKGKKSPGRAERKSVARIAEHISITERKAMLAERDTNDRYKVAYMTAHMGETYRAVVTGINAYGLFATISEIGVTGFLPVRSLGDGFFRFDERHMCLRSHRGGELFRIGQELAIVVEEANQMTGSLIFSLQGTSRTQQDEPHRKPREKHQRGKHRRREH